MRLLRREGTAAAVFLLTGLWLYWLNARRFVLIGDEGIYIDGARRILAGQVPYRDFFLVMGPGTFWLEALAFRVFGMTLPAARAMMILDLSIMAACVFWLVSRINWIYAVWVAAMLVIFETGQPGVILPTHRWDSAALATLALTLCAGQPRGWLVFAAGCCAAFAGWITPPVALVGGAILFWIWREDRAKLFPFLAGCSAVTICSAAALALQGGLGPMIRQLFWNSSHYSAANHMVYGSIFGGYAQLFAGSGTLELLPRTFVVAGLALPAILPVLAALLFWSVRKDPFFQLLFLGGLALVASTYPRMDLAHLTFVMPWFYALVALLAAGAGLQPVKIAACVCLTILAGLFAGRVVALHGREAVLQASVGTIRVPVENQLLIAALQETIPTGTRLFVFPYLPMAYFLTLSRNPTRYSYLQPGMMSEEDESKAISELSADAPERVLYFDLPEPEILKRWPGTDPAHLHLRRIEGYLAANYHRLAAIGDEDKRVEILEANGPRERGQIPVAKSQ
jgi:hypothetical protein